MRVKGKGGTEAKVEGKGGGGERHAAPHVASASRPSFGMSVEDAMAELEVRELLNRLNSVAGKLSLFPAERLLTEYRTVLKELLARIMKGFTMKRDLKWRRNSRSTYITIEKVESAMEELEEAFKNESGRSRTLQLMEEIKGCLISLLF